MVVRPQVPISENLDGSFPPASQLLGKYAPEAEVVASLLDSLRLTDTTLHAIESDAVALVEAFRADPKLKTLLDAFLQEYGLSNNEGIALMCLAEALLRVPDAQTRDDLIADKLSSGDWSGHLGSDSGWLVNASTWGLMLTGRVTTLDPQWSDDGASALGRLTNRLGEPVIRVAVARAMKILGGEFVLGETIKSAISRGRKAFPKDQLYSFDMLGEGARTFADAERHFTSYQKAIAAVAKMGGGDSVLTRSGISVKLSAIYPRYEFAHREAAMETLVARLTQLAQAAQAANIKLTMDAEEADRLDLSLDIFEAVARQIDVKNWHGFGLAIQAYGKRARGVIARVANLGRALGARFMVRLVKGAYWDAEIKHAQELGLPGFTVFTRKSSTDLSYLVCAQDMLDASDVMFSQFATHNAHTIAACMAMGADKPEAFEFQRLHGMGEGIYAVAESHYPNFPPARVYAPVGGHKDLLAYLVRRLLENGANSSFVNRFMDADVSAREVVRDPVRATRALETLPHPHIRLPEEIFGARKNAKGLDLTQPDTLAKLQQAQAEIYAQTYAVSSLANGLAVDASAADIITNPARLSDQLGAATPARTEVISDVVSAAAKAQGAWNGKGGAVRGAILRDAADRLEGDTLRLMAILTREAGKTQDDALAEVREAVDFLRYYAAQAETEWEHPQMLPGPSGERNELYLVGRGVFVCISPWNFPLAIFLGQVAAALAAGNAVIAKPAEQTPVIAIEATRHLYAAGVPTDVLMTLLGGGNVGAALVEHPHIAGVAFTGSTATAKRINLTLAEKPGPIVPLIAETGGQNVMFVDSTALLEQVADDVVTSAFKSAGQRCSALRVLYLQDDIADAALAMIRGAMDSYALGDPIDLTSDIGPIIDAAAATKLNAHIVEMSRKGAKTHAMPEGRSAALDNFVIPHLIEIEDISVLKEENFGPILHVVRYRAKDLEATLAAAFATGYGLTLGVHTRMDRRWQQIFDRAPVGNTYVNRNMTGAVVGSQPFGGMGLSGTGFKAGGPRYMYRFANEKTLTINTMASGGNTELLTLD